MHASLLHLGPLHLPVFSAFAVVGLITALLLSQRTAPLAGLAKEAMWDACVMAALAVFVVSRVLLVAFNFKSFLAYPLLVLSLPSVTLTGVLVSGALMSVYLRFRGLRAMRVLDAAAPCLALLWAVLSLGEFAMGSKGLPATVPWAFRDAVLGPVHPVELYAAVAFTGLAGALLLFLRESGRAGAPAGKVTSTALFAAGILLYMLDFFAQPAAISSYILLDPVEWLGAVMIVAGVLLALPHMRTNVMRAREEQNPHAV